MDRRSCADRRFITTQNQVAACIDVVRRQPVQTRSSRVWPFLKNTSRGCIVDDALHPFLCPSRMLYSINGLETAYMICDKIHHTGQHMGGAVLRSEAVRDQNQDPRNTFSLSLSSPGWVRSHLAHCGSGRELKLLRSARQLRLLPSFLRSHEVQLQFSFLRTPFYTAAVRAKTPAALPVGSAAMSTAHIGYARPETAFLLAILASCRLLVRAICQAPATDELKLAAWSHRLHSNFRSVFVLLSLPAPLLFVTDHSSPNFLSNLSRLNDCLRHGVAAQGSGSCRNRAYTQPYAQRGRCVSDGSWRASSWNDGLAQEILECVRVPFTQRVSHLTPRPSPPSRPRPHHHDCRTLQPLQHPHRTGSRT
jgi:hypothetical protein